MQPDPATNANTSSQQPAPRRRKTGAVLAPLIVFAVLVAVFGFALKTGDPSKLPSALIGKPAPQTEFAPLPGLATDGQAVPGFSSAELANGKPVVVNFWASWCVPCAEEQPLLVKLQQRTGVALYGVNYKDDPVSARRFLGRFGNPFAAVGVDPNGRGAIEWGVYGMPETFVLNGKGEIIYKHVGPVSAQSLAEKVEPMIVEAQKAAAVGNAASTAPASSAAPASGATQPN
ncbi:DsbE family thiol:disulfide interchange protein [Hyphomicrobium sulfonivorans]|uniref:Cytochrome c-type biogenesis protein CcmG/DsbE, thiol:disulfide oxidoreductase n=1 Tax=Hyphomicrobium sulfonivorans TaxID=121290 RepID=A0A109BLQ0_HYPSL|nr:DsbE family thiol:disulfide interchange protein [Hyphomicrobium sulfonivorans]KWT71088.1 Cytochrome c-type biogenesis protein CcmG/DsbE, thiol:disulfide oxidoreductase [Hyphomicrobium sulfonivorans]MBI1648466.1 DsbE family thiol:disulfide interchange protein [Hyphomicrobium sulfonivorans]NSL70996.1 DsbE family thiol:disulfide interchange protein [Hyphomicrobium sulfonivorans]